MPAGPKRQPSRRGRKVNVNFAADPELIERFREANQAYVGRLSGCFSGAIAMWLASHPEEQGKWLKRVLAAEVDGEVRTLIEQLRDEQRERVEQASNRPRHEEASE
jgi:hypothetical protein